MKLTIETAKVYRLRSFGGDECFAWADISIRSWKSGGSIDVQSDFGSYSYSWSATGTDDIRDFLVRLGYDYFMTKAHPKHGYETDWEKTAEEIKRLILKDRRRNEINSDQARECFDAVERTDKDDGFFWQAREYPELYSFLTDHEYPNQTRRVPQCHGFWTVIWPEITNVWREEIEKEKAGPVPVEIHPPGR